MSGRTGHITISTRFIIENRYVRLILSSLGWELDPDCRFSLKTFEDQSQRCTMFDLTRRARWNVSSDWTTSLFHVTSFWPSTRPAARCSDFEDLTRGEERSNQIIMHTTTLIYYTCNALLFHVSHPPRVHFTSHTLPLALYPRLIRLLRLTNLTLLVLLLHSLRRNRRRSSPSSSTLVYDLINLCVRNLGVLGTIVSSSLAVSDVPLTLTLGLSA